jgi:hypothetical protein
VLPDGHFVLEIVDQFPAGLEGLAAMRTGDGDDDGEVTDPEIPHPVHGRERPHRVLGDDLRTVPTNSAVPPAASSPTAVKTSSRESAVSLMAISLMGSGAACSPG